MPREDWTFEDKGTHVIGTYKKDNSTVTLDKATPGQMFTRLGLPVILFLILVGAAIYYIYFY